MGKILIVDDDVTTVTELEELLPSKGYDVVGAAFSGDEAIKMAAESKPDLILMDIGMPGKIGGITAAQKIKETLGIPVLFLTGHSEEEVIERAKNAEPLRYIMKPFSEAQIDAAIQIALNKKDMDHEMSMAHDELEKMVRERTTELVRANDRLRGEIIERERALEELKKREQELEVKTVELEETNVALNILLKKRERDRKEIGERVVSNVKMTVGPYLKGLKNSDLDQRQIVSIELIEAGLNDIVSSFSVKLSSKYFSLTPGELQVAYLIREGKRTKEIAELLNLSGKTIEDYRKNLRKKLGITNMKVNLRTHLLSIQ